MIKKIIVIAFIALVGYFVVFVVPRMIHNQKTEAEIKAAEMQKKAEKKAAQTIGDKLGITGGNAGFGGKFTEKAKENVDKATERSANYMDRIDDE